MIANETNLSIDGVRYHLQRIYRKLEINSKAELIAIALF
jgi:DNA-binding CsgD family transcriptional regulator